MKTPVAELPPPHRLLIVKPSALGDMVTAMPILRGLRRTFGDIRIDWLVGKVCAPLVTHDSDIDNCIVFDRRRLGRLWRMSTTTWREFRQLLRSLGSAHYDWVIDLQGLFRSGFFTLATRAPVRIGFACAREGATLFYTHRIPADMEQHTVDRTIDLARQIGIDARKQDMTLQIAGDAAAFAERFIDTHSLGEGFIICSPSTRWPTKLYPVRHWRRVVGELAKQIPVVILAPADDGALCQTIAAGLGPGVIGAAGHTDVAQLVAMIAASRGVICCDSAAKFIAPAVGTDVVTLMGPTRVHRTGPYLRGTALLADVPCQGCLRRQCKHITCMELIDPADVVSAVEGMLAAEIV